MTAFIFCGALLAHELGHAAWHDARAPPVEGIPLWPFGGMTPVQAEAASPLDALRVALVGPMISVAAAGVFGVLALILSSLGAPALVGGMAAWHVRLNVILAALNLIPGTPLDGGGVLQAILWRRSADRLAASVAAARAGRGFGLVLIGVGVLQFPAGIGAGGLSFVVIGWWQGGSTPAPGRVCTLEGVSVTEGLTEGPGG